MRAVEGSQQALPRWFEQKWMQRVRRREERAMNFAAHFGPRELTVRVGEQRVERELGALKRHRHAVAGEWRNHRARVAEADAICRRHAAVKGNGGDGAERIGVEFCGGEAREKLGEPGGLQVAEEEVRPFPAEVSSTEETADIGVTARNGT